MRNFKTTFILFLALATTVSPSWAGQQHTHAKEGHGQGEVQEDGHDHDNGHDHGEEETAIKLSEESQALGGIKTAKVARGPYASRVSVSGRIAQDVEDVKYVFAPQSARVKECNVSLGADVKHDEVLCTVTLTGSGAVLDIRSPMDGVVISEFVKKGEHVDETTALYAIADMTRLWANFDIYEKDVASIKLGQKMLVYPLSYPNKAFDGEIVFISPRVDESTYTVKIRANVQNAGQLLKLGMSVRGEILIEAEGEVITIPSEAIQTVEGKAVVFKKTDKGFEPQVISIASQTQGAAAVETGLNEGDQIVVQGSFILKSKMLESEMGHDHDH